MFQINVPSNKEDAKQLLALDKFVSLNNIDPNDYEFNPRSDGRIELICDHGVGHTIYSPNDNFIHGCDGCCKNFKVIRNIKSEEIK